MMLLRYIVTAACLFQLGLAFQSRNSNQQLICLTTTTIAQSSRRSTTTNTTTQRRWRNSSCHRLLSATNNNDDGDSESNLSRRSIFERSFAAAAVIPSLLINPLSVGADITSPARSASPAGQTFISPSEAQITQKVFMNIRISRQDGTFYVRDDLPDTPENRVFSCRLVIGLFGKNCPTHVERFLSYIRPNKDDDDDNPLPNYGRSYFTSSDQATGLLLGGMIPSLELTEIGGNTAIRYGGRLQPASLWVERPSSTTADGVLPPRISHRAKGLLTHRLLDATPVFGITTRSDTTILDRTHNVFGTIMFGESTGGDDFIKTVQDLPTYSLERPASMMNDPVTGGNSIVDEAAGAVFNAQKQFFRNAAKTLGDNRLDKVYEGKLLRRVQVTQVGMA